MALFVPPSIRHFLPERLVFSAWVDHMAFGYDIVAEARPRVLVELGTHNALSYFTFCQSIKQHDIDSVAYAVDTWQGEEHSGVYGDDVFQDVQSHSRENYPGFSYLMRMLFDEAVVHFADDSIDLLHIDGLHTYEAVSHDFETWYPKVRPGGIILFHDISSRLLDFGVWRFWDEIKDQSPTFSFIHGFGLGVLRKPCAERPTGQLQQIMFEGTEADHADLRAFYTFAARYVNLSHRAAAGAMPPKIRPAAKVGG